MKRTHQPDTQSGQGHQHRGFSKAKAALAVAAAGGLAATAAIIVPGTLGNFSASTSNLSNTVNAGTLAMTNSKSGAVVTVGSTPGMRPGDAACGQTTITNSGSLSASSVQLKESNVTDGPGTPTSKLSGDLTLSVYQDVTNLSTDGACTVTGGTSVFSGKFDGSSSGTPLTTGINVGGTWTSSQAHAYTFVVNFPNSAGVGADNAYQGENTSADFTWTSQS